MKAKSAKSTNGRVHKYASKYVGAIASALIDRELTKISKNPKTMSPPIDVFDRKDSYIWVECDCVD